MSINVKKLKRVTLGGEPLKEFNAGDKKPAFRQNGYGLTFDAANQDFLEFDIPIVLSGDWFLDMKVDSAVESNVQAPLTYFIGGDFNTNVIQTYTQGRVLLVLSSESVNFNTNDTVPRTGLYTMKFVKTGLNIELFVDGISKGTKTIGSEDTLTIDTIGGHVTNRYYDGSVHHVDLNGEKFNFTESRGTTTTGSEGTIGTINTSNAGGVQYLDSTVWNKKSFALELEVVNSEYLSGLTASLTDGQTIEAEFSLTDASTVSLFGSNLTSIVYIKVTPTLVQIRDTNQGNLNYGSSLTIGQKYMLKVARVVDNIEVFIDNVSLGVNATSPLALYNFAQIGRSGGGAVFSNVSIYNFTINNEQFNLTEGLGNQVYGSNGTIGTINTSNAQGIERTNYGQWLKSGNVLKFESSNNDFLQFDNDIVLSGDFTLSVDLVSNISFNGQSLFGQSKVSLFGAGKIYFKTDTDSLYLSTVNKLPQTGAFVYVIERIGNDTFFYADGVLVDTISGYNGDMTLDTLGQSGSSTFDGSIKSFTINSEKFQFREGQGITTEGSLGTTATINTSHAGGTQYINEQVWNVDSNKYIDYE